MKNQNKKYLNASYLINQVKKCTEINVLTDEIIHKFIQNIVTHKKANNCSIYGNKKGSSTTKSLIWSQPKLFYYFCKELIASFNCLDNSSHSASDTV
jgi:hypothetical protein